MDKDPRQYPRAPSFSFPPNLCYCESSRDSRLLVWPEAPSSPLCMIYCFGKMLSLSFLAWPQTIDPLQHLLPGTGCVISHPVLGSSLTLSLSFSTSMPAVSVVRTRAQLRGPCHFCPGSAHPCLLEIQGFFILHKPTGHQGRRESRQGIRQVAAPLSGTSSSRTVWDSDG